MADGLIEIELAFLREQENCRGRHGLREGSAVDWRFGRKATLGEWIGQAVAVSEPNTLRSIDDDSAAKFAFTSELLER